MDKIIGKSFLTVLSVIIIMVVSGALILSCGGGGGIAALVGVAAILGSLATSAGPVVGISAVFLGGLDQQPAVVLPFTSEAQSIVVTPDGKKVFVTDALHNTVSVIDADTRNVTAVVDVKTNPKTAAVTPDGKKVYVSSFGLIFDDRDIPGQSVTVIDAVQENILTHIQVAPRPTAIVFMPDGKKAYVAHTFFDDLNPDEPGLVSIIDTVSDTLIGQIQLTHLGATIQETTGMVISRDGKYLYVLAGRTVSSTNGSVAVIDTSNDQPIQIVPVGGEPAGIAIDPDGTRLYVTNKSDSSVSVFDVTAGTALEIGILQVDNAPGPVVVSPDGKKTYVAHIVTGQFGCPTEEDPLEPALDDIGKTVTVIDTVTNSVLPVQIEVGPSPIGMVITTDNTQLYTISGCEAKLSTVNTDLTGLSGLVTADIIDVEARANAIALSEKKSEVYVVHPHAISVIDTTTKSIAGPVIPIRGDGPTELAVGKVDNQDRFKLYALHPGAKRVSVVEADNGVFQLAGNFDLDARPSSMILSDTIQEYLTVAISGYSKSTLNSRTLDNRLVRIQVSPFGVDDILVSPPTEVGDGPLKMMADSAKERVFVAAFGHFFNNSRDPQGRLRRVDLNTGNASIVSGDITIGSIDGLVKPIDLTTDTINGKMYIADFGSGGDTGKILSLALDEDDPVVSTFTSDVNRPVSIGVSGDMLYAADYHVRQDKFSFRGFDVADAQNAVSKINLEITGVNPSKIVFATIGADNAAIVLQSGDRSYICDESTQAFCDTGAQVSVINLATQAFESIPVGSKPVDAVVVGGKIFVSDYFSGTVTVIDAASIDFDNSTVPAIRTLSVGKGPSAMVTEDGKVFVANSIESTVSVISADVDFSQVSVTETISL